MADPGRRPVHGRDKAIAFLLGLASRYAVDDVRLIEVNGQPAVWLTIDGQGEVVTIGVREGRIGDVFVVLNPDKLAHAVPGPE